MKRRKEKEKINIRAAECFHFFVFEFILFIYLFFDLLLPFIFDLICFLFGKLFAIDFWKRCGKGTTLLLVSKSSNWAIFAITTRVCNHSHSSQMETGG